MTPRTNHKRLRFSSLQRFAGNTTGVATIEFAFLVPLLMLMSFGAFEIGRAVIVHKRVQHATDMVADLVSREKALGATIAEANAELNGIMRAAEHSMSPYSKTPLKMSVTSLRAAAANANITTVEWAYKYNGKPNVLACPQVKTMPDSGMVMAGNTAIMVEAEYQYTPLLTNIIPGLVKPIKFQDKMVYAPRNACVDVGGNNCVGTCVLTVMSGP